MKNAMKICGIYGIKNLSNGKIYIGQSLDVKSRKRKHFAALTRGDHTNEHLQRAFSIYGKDNFEFHVLEEVSEAMLDIRESAWIAYYKTNQYQFGYNMDTGGGCNRHLSEEICKKISDSKKGKPSGYRGHHPSAETRRKISQALKGHHPSIESCRKMSQSQQQRRRSINE